MSDGMVMEAAALFDDHEKWISFFELCDLRQRIYEYWVRKATQTIRDHFYKTRSDKWVCEPYGDTNRDTRWYLREFGMNSLGITIGWFYEIVLHLPDGDGYDTNAITEKLSRPEFMPISMAFDRIDYQQKDGKKLVECRNYIFDGQDDGGIMQYHDLAWYAGNQTGAFVTQVIGKVERLICDPKVTDLIIELNATTKK